MIGSLFIAGPTSKSLHSSLVGAFSKADGRGRFTVILIVFGNRDSFTACYTT